MYEMYLKSRIHIMIPPFGIALMLLYYQQIIKFKLLQGCVTVLTLR